MPALDGLRAFAVVSVMAYHSGLSILPAGFFGVDAFFVLSGFLITSLLVSEWSSSNTIALRAFWGRRARRLLPALLVVIVFVALYARFGAQPGSYPGLRSDALSALFYSANWRFIVSGQNYFVQHGLVSPLLHTWSLAIEEQFYILWPILVLVVMGRATREISRRLRVVLVVSVVGALSSAVEMALLFDPSSDPTRLYFGTDSHAQCLLVGTSLAALLALRRQRGAIVASDRARRLTAAAGMAGVVVCAWAWSQLHYGQTFVFRGGFLVVALAVAAVIASAVLVPLGVVGRALAWGPLRFVGRISYGMYLWHFPLDIVLTKAVTGTSGVWLFLVRSAVTVAVSTASFFVLERPIRSGALLSALRARIVAPTAMAVTAAVVLVATAAPSVADVSASAPLAPGPSTPPAGVAQPTPPSDGLAGAPVRVLVVGDSVAFAVAQGLAYSEPAYRIQQVDEGVFGCGIALGSTTWSDLGGQVVMASLQWPCHTHPSHGEVPWPQAWPTWLRQVKPNVVVLLAGRWEVVDRTLKGRRTNILDPAFASYVKHMLEKAVRIGTASGAHMVMMTAPCFDEGEQLDGSPFPEDDPRRLAAYNRLVRQVAAEFPASVTLQDLDAMVCPGGRFRPDLHGVPLRSPDGVHFASGPGVGADALASQILPLWVQLGHAQEASGGAVPVGPPPTQLAPA